MPGTSPQTSFVEKNSQEPSRTAVHFGAGNIGRGFIGPILVEAGFHVVFADINEDVISKINQEQSYSVHYLEPRCPKPFHVSHISGVLSTSEELAEGISDNETKLVTTSVGFPVLKHIAEALARGIELRRRLAEKDNQSKDWSLNVIACENGVGASQNLKDEVWSHLKEDKDKEWAGANVGFPNCSVDRIVPPFDPEENEVENPLDVGVDRFYEWIVDTHALRPSPRALSPIPGLTLTPSLPAFVERKLFILNCGHAITAYLGDILKVPEGTIYAAISNTTHIFPVVKGAMHESAAALLHKHSDIFNDNEMKEYVVKTIDRFRNPNVVDDIKRVGRQPLRKLGRDERLLGPAYMAREFGLPITNLAKGIAAAIMYVEDEQEDEQAKELLNIIKNDGIDTAVEKVTGFKKGGEEWKEVISAWKELEGWRGKAAEATKN